MNCDTLEMTDRPSLIKEWLAAGVPVLQSDTFEALSAAREEVQAFDARERGSLLLDTLGAKIVDAKQEADETSNRRREDFLMRLQTSLNASR